MVDAKEGFERLFGRFSTKASLVCVPGVRRLVPKTNVGFVSSGSDMSLLSWCRRENISAMRRQCEDLEADEAEVNSKIKKKRADVDRAEKRLKSLQVYESTVGNGFGFGPGERTV